MKFNSLFRVIEIYRDYKINYLSEKQGGLGKIRVKEFMKSLTSQEADLKRDRFTHLEKLSTKELF